MDILLATGNPAKIENYGAVIELAGLTMVVSNQLEGLVVPEIDEDANDLEDNARKKAVAFARASGMVCLTSDEGGWVEGYSDKDNEIFRLEPRRLGSGRRLTDEEVVAWHNERLERAGGLSLSRWKFALCVGWPDGRAECDTFVQVQIFYVRQDDFPPMREGYPMDSQSKIVREGKTDERFVSELQAQDRLPSGEMSVWLRSVVRE